MKVLFLTYDVPYPLISGGKIRAYHLIKNLAQKHQITLFSYYRSEKQRQYFPELKKYCRKIFLFKRRPPWHWQNLLRCLTSSLPFTATVYHHSGLRQTLVDELKNNQYDLVHFESFYPALYLPLVKKMGIKTLLGNENIEWQIYDRYACQQFLPIKWLLRLEVWRMKLYEEKLWRQADVNIAPSKADAKMIGKITGRKCPVISNGVDLGSIKPRPEKLGSPTIIFVGTMIYQANNDAVWYFLKEIYPMIKSQVPQVKFILVSWHKPSWLNNFLVDTSIEFVQDRETTAYEFFRRAGVLVAPIRIASGTRIKILEAMAAGLPVVTSSVGIEGIEANVGKEVIIADDPQDFANQVVELLANKNRRQELSLAGRKLVKKLYSWETIAEKLNKIYEKA